MDQIPPESNKHFFKFFNSNSKLVVEITHINIELFKSEINSYVIDNSILNRFKQIIENLENEEKLYLLKIEKTSKNLVYFN